MTGEPHAVFSCQQYAICEVLQSSQVASVGSGNSLHINTDEIRSLACFGFMPCLEGRVSSGGEGVNTAMYDLRAKPGSLLCTSAISLSTYVSCL